MEKYNQTAGINRDAFFLDTDTGKLFCLYYSPKSKRVTQHILFVHSFGDEMNKSRKLVSLQAEAFAGRGMGVLIVDLIGCGDSEKNFIDATWDQWEQNVQDGYRWLIEKEKVSIALWGMRLGCLLIADVVQRFTLDINFFLFWQPVLKGPVFINQLVRLKKTSALLAEDKSGVSAENELQEYGYTEIAGYRINKELFHSIRQSEIKKSSFGDHARIIWKEIHQFTPATLRPTTQRIFEMWRSRGMLIEDEIILGKTFWNTVEIELNDALIDSTMLSIDLP